jgi:hypothetical protein
MLGPVEALSERLAAAARIGALTNHKYGFMVVV